MNNFEKIIAVAAVIITVSLYGFATPLHPVYSLAGLATGLVILLLVLFKMEDEGLLS